jgi:hypothetical protein
MFGLRRIRQLQAEIAVLRGALDFYAINDNWRRRAKHVKGRQWELSTAAKDHGARAREALVKADAIRRRPLAKLRDKVRQHWQSYRSDLAARRAIASAATVLKRGIRVPAPTNAPETGPTGEIA